MNWKVLFLTVFTTLLLPLTDVSACTSFAVYSKQAYYGMNFDFATLPMKFLISVNGDIRTFHLAFERSFGDTKFFVNTAGMNDRGLFASCQELHPVNAQPPERTDANLFTFELYEAIASGNSVKEIERTGRSLPLTDMPGLTLHNLFADPTGRAVVTEATTAETAIIENQENFLVMTNFPNRSLQGKTYKDAKGKGDQRYIICHEYLRQHAFDFSIDKGFELLALSVNKDPLYPTSCSMVFDPQKKEVYIALDRNFSKILKLNIGKGTIETFKGYKTNTSLSIPDGPEGLLADALRRLN